MPRVQVNEVGDDSIVDRGAVAAAELRDFERALEELLSRPDERQAVLVSSDGQVRVDVPSGTLELFGVLVSKLADQGRVGIVGMVDELSTQEAADLLNVSRQYVVRLMDEGRLRHHTVGAHRRAFARDVLAFKRDRDKKRRGALRRIVSLSEAAGGYDAERKRSQ